MVTEGFAILDVVPPILMVLAIEALTALGWVTSHLVWPFEVRLILYLFKYLMYRLLEYQANYLSVSMCGLVDEVSSRLIMDVPIKPGISSFRGGGRRGRGGNIQRSCNCICMWRLGCR